MYNGSAIMFQGAIGMNPTMQNAIHGKPGFAPLIAMQGQSWEKTYV
jgi:hypothetical protein